MTYSDEFLLDIANSTNCPDFDPELQGYQTFPAKEGWTVQIWYEGGCPEYLNNVIAPNGEAVDCWDNIGTASRNRILSWCGVERPLPLEVTA
ncbi:hypothetical protein ABIA16_003551 [Sinorhizobium fredii]